MRMIQAGLGDILAKYNSICEWQISHLINDEYYCDAIAELMHKAVRKCVAQAHMLTMRDPDAVQAVTEGLLEGGAGSYAQAMVRSRALPAGRCGRWKTTGITNCMEFKWVLAHCSRASFTPGWTKRNRRGERRLMQFRHLTCVRGPSGSASFSAQRRRKSYSLRKDAANMTRGNTRSGWSEYSGNGQTSYES